MFIFRSWEYFNDNLKITFFVRKWTYWLFLCRNKLGYATGACWSRSRLSLFFTINTEGTLDAYDLFQGINKPCYRIQICEKSLTTIKPHNDGKILAIGSTNGNVYFVLCGGLFTTTFPNDKYFFLSVSFYSFLFFIYLRKSF